MFGGIRTLLKLFQLERFAAFMMPRFDPWCLCLSGVLAADAARVSGVDNGLGFMR